MLGSVCYSKVIQRLAERIGGNNAAFRHYGNTPPLGNRVLRNSGGILGIAEVCGLHNEGSKTTVLQRDEGGQVMWVLEYHNDGGQIITTYDPQHQAGVAEWYQDLTARGELYGYQIGDE